MPEASGAVLTAYIEERSGRAIWVHNLEALSARGAAELERRFHIAAASMAARTDQRLAQVPLLDEVEELDDVELALDVPAPADDPDDLPVFAPIEEDDFKPLPVMDDEQIKPEFTFNQPWQMPDAGDLREILSQMEEDDLPPPPPTRPVPKKRK